MMHEDFNKWFDAWVELYKDDPELFEKNRLKYINHYIDTRCGDNVEKAKRYKAFFWRSQQEFRNIKDPIERVNQVCAQFWKSVHELNRTLKDAGFGGNNVK